MATKALCLGKFRQKFAIYLDCVYLRQSHTLTHEAVNEKKNSHLPHEFLNLRQNFSVYHMPGKMNDYIIKNKLDAGHCMTSVFAKHYSN